MSIIICLFTHPVDIWSVSVHQYSTPFRSLVTNFSVLLFGAGHVAYSVFTLQTVFLLRLVASCKNKQKKIAKIMKHTHTGTAEFISVCWFITFNVIFHITHNHLIYC